MEEFGANAHHDECTTQLLRARDAASLARQQRARSAAGSRLPPMLSAAAHGGAGNAAPLCEQAVSRTDALDGVKCDGRRRRLHQCGEGER
jgi:hypothetical protein